ncbi:MAG TPA: winged helix DNA-binding domain-containing protein [Micromonosporaceae bacterium]|jgi:hypothetical protein
MPRPLDDDVIRRLRTRAQRLAGERPARVTTAVAAVTAVPAQSTPAARLAVRCRADGATAATVDRACARGSLVRTWAMRGTLHVLAAADVRWVVALLGPIFAAAGRRRRLQLGLDDATSERALSAIRAALAGSAPLTRADLVARVVDDGIAVDVDTQAPAHLVAYAAMRGLICRGPDLARDEPTYVLLDEWVPGDAPRDGDDALAELARRYLAGHAPAADRDLAAWSGLPASAARRGFALIADELREVRLGGATAYAPSTMELQPPADPVVRLLGAFDPYLLGYRGRELALDARYARRIQAGGGIIHPAVLVDGRVVGTWRLSRTGRAEAEATIRLEPFARLPRGVLDALEAEAADVGRFLGLPATLRIV